MKKLFSIILLMLAVSVTAHAQVQIYPIQIFGQSVALTSTTTASTPVSVIRSAITSYKFACYTEGTVTTAGVTFETSEDGSSWSTTISSVDCSNPNQSDVTSGSANYVRVNATTFAGTGTVFVSWRGYVDRIANISGPISGCANTYVAYFSGSATLDCEAAFNYVEGTNTLTVDNVVSNIGTALGLSATAPASGAGVGVTVSASDSASGNNAGGSIFLSPGNRSGSGTGNATVVGTNALTGLTATEGPIFTNAQYKSLISVMATATSNTRTLPVSSVMFSSQTTNIGGVTGYKSASATSGTLAAVGSGEEISAYLGRGAASATAWDTLGAGMYVIAGEAHTGSNQGKYIQFRTVANSATAQTNAWRIASSPVGDLLPEADNTYNLGGTSNRVLEGFFATGLGLGTGNATSTTRIHSVDDSNAAVVADFYNSNAGSAANMAVRVGNDSGTSSSTASLTAFGTSFATSGLSIADSGRVASGSALSGGLVVATFANAPITFGTNSTEKMKLTGAGNLLIGTTDAGTNAVSALVFTNGTAPTTSPADTVQLFSTDISAGNASLGLRTETAVAVDVETESTHTLSVTINGTIYKIMLATP